MACLAYKRTAGLDLHGMWCMAAVQAPGLCCTICRMVPWANLFLLPLKAAPDRQLGSGPTFVQSEGLRLLVLCIRCGVIATVDFDVILTDCPLLQASDASARESIEKVVEVLCGEPMSSFNDCIKWAVLRFQVRPHTLVLRWLVSSAGAKPPSSLRQQLAIGSGHR